MNSTRTPETYLAPCQTFKMEPFCKYRLQSDEQEQKAVEFKIFNIVYYPVCYFISRCIIPSVISYPVVLLRIKAYLIHGYILI